MDKEEEAAKNLDASIKKENKEWEESEEGQDFLRRMSDSNGSSSQASTCTVQNISTTQAVYVIRAGAVNQVHINPGSSYTFEAGEALYYSTNSGGEGALITPNAVVGQTYSVQ